jgi:alanine racemase
MYPTKAVINLSNLKSNFLNVRKKVKKTKVLAVVKADAYGHGVKGVVNALNTLGDKKPDFFGVASYEEGVEVRKLKVSQPILVFAPLSKDVLADVVRSGLSATVNSAEQITMLEKIKGGQKIKVHVKIDTGMGRLGLECSEAVALIKKLSSLKNVFIEGIYSHFAASDEKKKSFTNIQLQRFLKVIDGLKKENINYGITHIANSAAILDVPESYLDMVRIGISLYGYYPSSETTESIKIKPVMSIVSSVASTKLIAKGDSVSYNRRFYAKENTRVVSISGGYADGFNRNLTNKLSAIIKGKLYPGVGTVTMDRIMFNVGKDKVTTGDSVILIGSARGKTITAWDWAKILNTIPYEITCGISKRVPRIYM